VNRIVSYPVGVALVIGVAMGFLTERGAAPPVPQLPVPPTSPVSLSESGQFTVRDGTPAGRRDFANRCESWKRDVAAVAGFPTSTWRYPFSIVLTVDTQTRKPARRAVGRVYPVDITGYEFRLDLLLDPAFRDEEFHAELTKLLLLERMLDAARPEAPRDTVPDWILRGIEELVLYRRAGRPSDVFNALIDSNQVPPVSEVLATRTADLPDSVSRDIFRACSAALVKALLEQGSGPVRFQALLQDLAYAQEPESNLLKLHFPALSQEPASLSKWWTLQLASMSEQSAFEFLSAPETDRILEECLRIDLTALPASAQDVGTSASKGDRKLRLPDFKRRADPPADSGFTSGTIREHARFLGDPRAPAALRVCQARLSHLGARAFPMHRPILGDYDRLLLRLIAGDAKDATENLMALDRRRTELLERMTKVTDHLNWFVATEIQPAGDEFAGYAAALDLLRRMEARRRQDAVTSYLDAMERQLAAP